MSSSDLAAVEQLLSSHSVPADLVTVKSNPRAKRLIFKASLKKGVEIIVPKDKDSLWIIDTVASKISWIKSTRKHVRDGRSQLKPATISLKALDENWSVQYTEHKPATNKLTLNGDHSLSITTDSKDPFRSARQLQQWFHQRAKLSLLPWISSLAEERNLKFNRIYIKNQVSRWGSCSMKRNINLNRNLLFIPHHLVEYVLHHELTHLEHLDHSDRFWTAFTHVLPNCGELRRELRQLELTDTPLWASPRLEKL